MAEATDRPECCSLMQALLWVANGRQPILEEQFEAIASLRKIPEAEEPKIQLIVALNTGKVRAKGSLAVVTEDVEHDYDFPEDQYPRVPRSDQNYEAIRDSLAVEMTVSADIIEGGREIPKEAWQSENINWRYSTLEHLSVDPRGGHWSKSWQRFVRIRLNVPDLLAAIPTPAAQEASETSSGRRKGGRKHMWDWEAIFWPEVVAIANGPDGLPESQNELIRNLLDVFQAGEYEKIPDDGSMKARLTRVYKAG